MDEQFIVQLQRFQIVIALGPGIAAWTIAGTYTLSVERCACQGLQRYEYRALSTMLTLPLWGYTGSPVSMPHTNGVVQHTLPTVYDSASTIETALVSG